MKPAATCLFIFTCLLLKSPRKDVLPATNENLSVASDIFWHIYIQASVAASMNKKRVTEFSNYPEPQISSHISLFEC